uniref:beta-ketoacyl-[acyl-carrier-protein] synthase I n=2 Tax=Macrostomum lignano TaxID=282301 RepID=A0A1I8G1G1_9PLAT
SGCRRVVITGLGLAAPVGAGWRTVWAQVLAGRPNFGRLSEADGYSGLPCRVAGLIPEAELSGWPSWQFDKRNRAEMSRASALALAAAREAAQGADLAGMRRRSPDSLIGVAIGCGMDGLETAVDAGVGLRSGRGYAEVGPHFLTKLLNNMPAGRVAIEFGATGPCLAPNSACASGADAIGAAFRLVRDGIVDAALCGGTEACVGPLAVAAFSRVRALATRFNDNPLAASRPFDADRCGFVMSEGAGVLVLEALDSALARGAPAPIAEVLGYGAACDAHHLTAPKLGGDSGARRCMLAALREAGNHSAAWQRPLALQVGHVNAHATSTPIGDSAEWLAIESLLSGVDASVIQPGCLVASCKGALGHLIGAAGAVEAALTALSCQTGRVPPTANLARPDLPTASESLRLVPDGPPADWPTNPADGRRVALSNSFGFGGVNASLCIASYLP